MRGGILLAVMAIFLESGWIGGWERKGRKEGRLGMGEMSRGRLEEIEGKEVGVMMMRTFFYISFY